jgi:UDPglucose--hexose-1-phosphate uridylyltransferase
MAGSSAASLTWVAVGEMFKRVLRKPDGRSLILYSRSPIPADIEAPTPAGPLLERNAHLRWHPLRGEWVAYASHRQDRTFLPPASFNPLAPTVDPANPTEMPAGAYEVAVFENLFPTLVVDAHDPPVSIVETRPGTGICEVVVFTQDPNATLGSLPLSRIELLLEVWADRYVELGSLPDIHYVYPFENRGVEVGVTLHHPHGQIYAYPFVPPVAAQELEQQRSYFDRNGHGLLESIVRAEIDDGRRIVYQGGESIAFMPAFARYSYEVWVAPRQPLPSLAALNPADRADFARALKTVLLKFDGLWRRPFPYVMAFHQAPTDGKEYPEAHLHVEFYPAYRKDDRLKYLAGSELGAGVFTADTLPEDKAKELQQVEVNVDE